MHQQTMTTATMAYPSLPASPTLTNPDMILPYDYSSTPSPPQNPDRPPSPPGGWKAPGSRPGDANFSIGPPGHMQLGMGMGGGIGPMTPTTPIIYGNGTMLSDIGEVTEAESTPGRKPRIQTHNHNQASRTRDMDRDSPLRSSPTMGYNALLKRTKTGSHQRNVSTESTSTVTTEGQAAELFEDFDDGVSVDDSNFQGDDEESVADSVYEHQLEVAQAQRVVMRKDVRIGGGGEEDSATQSSAALSRRAEMILANAKKRLDNMEGNLTRARSSLYITPSSSMSSIHSSSPLSRSTPSPPDADRRIIAGLGVPPSRHRQLNQISIPTSPGHSRVLSENSIPTSPYSPPYPIPRSVSAAAGFPGSVEVDDKDHGRPAYSTPLSRASNHYNAPLEPLNEDDPSPARDWDPETFRSSTADPYSQPSTTDHRGLTRSASSMQMRDLTDKMKDLKGKISTLRDRAREDTMKRRSLQSLRTPSPFTAAEQWYAASKGDAKAPSLLAGSSPWNGESSIVGAEGTQGHEMEEKNESAVGGEVEGLKYAESDAPSIYEDVEEARGANADQDHVVLSALDEHDETYDTAEEEDTLEDEEALDDGDYNDELVDPSEASDYESEGEASLYHDSLTTPISHEDREDAFDYEHFFLHSAMGTLSQQRGRNGSVSSFSSEDSVETTRGLEAPAPVTSNGDVRTAKGHLRGQKSTDSVSTLATFATARERTSEDLGSRDFEETLTDLPEYVEGEEEENGEGIADEERPETPLTAKRSTFGTPTKLPLVDREATSTSADENENVRPGSAIRDGESVSNPATISNGGANGIGIANSSSRPNALHRPSVSSFASTGTTRSFPLVNKPKSHTTSFSSSGSIVNHANSSSTSLEDVRNSSPVQMLVKDDQILVERLVASLGKCVLGLQDAGRASTEGRMWRRRLEAARRVLEGMDETV